MSYGRPPPTSYRDAAERWHPGPGCDGYVEHAAKCRPCRLRLRNAADGGEFWARKLDAIVRLTTPDALMLDVNRSRRTLSKRPPDTDASALVTAPRSLPARWRQHLTPGRVISGSVGLAAARLCPPSVCAVLIVLLLVAAAAIHRYVPDLVPAARVRR